MRTPLVLVAEDNVLIRELMCEILQLFGVSTLPTCNADTAADLFKRHADQLVLVVTDVRMPGVKDGYDLARLIYTLRPTLPVIVTSGYVGEQKLAQSANVTFLPKPWNVKQFELVVQRYLGAAI